jgi:hypothetical protein
VEERRETPLMIISTSFAETPFVVDVAEGAMVKIVRC